MDEQDRTGAGQETEEMLEAEDIDMAGDPAFEDSPTDESPSEGANTLMQQLRTGDPERIILTGMYKEWFLDYASYVILERAVPHMEDGLKPVQRRILHTMSMSDDGRYNKVANIVGQTMQFHPHGDASIGDALVGLGQKELLIDTQGNWGNLLTGDAAAAPRYIEARLTPFAKEVLFNRKTTDWMVSYDGRKEEPITLPAKFPLLLAHGTEGIAVGLSCNVLPHNFNEIIDAAVRYLQGQDFTLYPDFPTGGLLDVTHYADGLRGGSVKIRARITKLDRKTLVIREIPFRTTTSKLIDSIRKEHESGRIRLRKIEDNTAAEAEIVIHLAPDMSPDKTIDALYAFTMCEVREYPNACVIRDQKPHFLGVSDILRHSVDHTKNLLRRELEIRQEELEQIWHSVSLERIFIEHRLYLSIEECTTWEDVLATIERELQPYVHLLRRPLTQDDLIALTEIKIKRISKYDKRHADDLIRKTEDEMQAVREHLEHLVDFTIEYFKNIKKKYGKPHSRRTEITSFEEIQAMKVVATNKKLYVDRENGFVGTELKGADFVCDCSDLDEVITILRNGKYLITQVSDKRFLGKDIVYCNVFTRNDNRTIYNLVYYDGRSQRTFWKRCAISSIIRDREYDLTQGTPGSKLLYLSANHNGEAEVIRIFYGMRTAKGKEVSQERDFAELAVRGKETRGNQLSKGPVRRVSLFERGSSTLDDVKVWIDRDINRLNYDARGEFLGEFASTDLVLAIYARGAYETTSFDESTRFGEDLIRIEKFEPQRVFSAAFFDSDQGYCYLKRFTFEPTQGPVSFIGESAGARLMDLTSESQPVLRIKFGGEHYRRPSERVQAEEFIGVKSYRARGKRLSTYTIESLKFEEGV